MKRFKDYVNLREAGEVPPGVDPQMWANPSYQKFWLAQNPQQQQQPAPAAKALVNPMQQKRMQQELDRLKIFERTIDAGFKTGGVVRSNIVKSLGLNDANRSLVADSEQFALGGAYPFYKKKFAGKYETYPEDRGLEVVLYKKGYNIHTFIDKFTNLLKERYSRM